MEPLLVSALHDHVTFAREDIRRKMLNFVVDSYIFRRLFGISIKFEMGI